MTEPDPAHVAWVDQMKAHMETEADLILHFYDRLVKGEMDEGYAFKLTRDRLEYMHSHSGGEE